MEATQVLMEEHRVIERVLNTLEKAAAQVEAGQPVRPGFFVDAADFARGFGDGCHHKKEEDVLFPALVNYGLSSRDGPVAVMLSEHEQGRYYIKGMRQAAERLEAGDPAARAKLVEYAYDYVTLLRQHIQKEDHILFPMADQVIPTGSQARLADEFDHIEHEETGEGIHEKYLGLANALETELHEVV